MHSLPKPYDDFCAELRRFVAPARLIQDPLRTLAYGTDASFYRLIPKLVVKAESEAEVARILRVARKHATPVTFRAAGTSVSGQSITDSVLLVLGDQWKHYEINTDGSQIRLQPGVIGGHANRCLAPFNRKIGPDPASINAAKIGGIAANNASGMCCQLAHDSYHTLVNARIVLADGTVIDTVDKSTREAFAETHRDLLTQVDELARRTRANALLAKRIREKFQIRNTSGYSINALIDFEDPIDILQHLMIGSEGTLGFISEITYRTVADPPHKASALVLFPNIKDACEAAAIVKARPVAAVELMDRAALRSVEDKTGMPDYLDGLPEDAASLLIETRATDSTSLKRQIKAIASSIADVKTLFPVHFTDDVEENIQLWNVRKGLYPSIGAMRETGTSVITEDVVFPIPKLASATLDLQRLLRKHSYDEAIMLGHALEGNLHFIFTKDFGKYQEIERYRRFMDDFAKLVVGKYDASLKGEHGTGRNMAPYVEFEWGRDAYDLMRDIKSMLDPDNILNPGVILNSDREVHLKNLKPSFPVDPVVDKCIECGMCELTCPSSALTLTPRQRIVGLREIARLEASGEEPQRRIALQRLYRYDGVDSCAGDGLCALACPVGIDTGQMMRILRARRIGERGNKASRLLADNFSVVSKIARGALRTANIAHIALGTSLMQGLTGGVRKLSRGHVPAWNPYMPTAARVSSTNAHSRTDAPRVVYFPSCASRTMGPAKGDPERDSLPAKTEALLRKAGYEVVYPEDCERLCCGMPFESKGLMASADAKADETVQRLLRVSRNGKDAIVSDTSPCALYLKQRLKDDATLFDITEFVHDFVMPRLTLRRRSEPVALHPTCSIRKMGLEDKLRKIAEACAEQVIVPEGVACCGWAGDKGFTHPELTMSALRDLRASLPSDCMSGYSTSRTCEIGLSYHSGRHYRSIVYLVDGCTQRQP